jgi:hypothetical protein
MTARTGCTHNDTTKALTQHKQAFCRIIIRALLADSFLFVIIIIIMLPYSWPIPSACFIQVAATQNSTCQKSTKAVTSEAIHAVC